MKGAERRIYEREVQSVVWPSKNIKRPSGNKPPKKNKKR